MQVESDLRGDVHMNELAPLGSPSPEQIFASVFRELRPRSPLPQLQVDFRRYANARAQLKLHDGLLSVQIADTFASAPEEVLGALAEILLSKLFRRPVPKAASQRYRRWLNRKEVRAGIEKVRQARGWKQMLPPQGVHFDLEEIFEELNFRYFFGLMPRPKLGWSRQVSRTMLGHYDPSHHTIILSRILDQARANRLAVEFVLFHEMLHIRYPADHSDTRRCVHTRDFKKAEKQFERYQEAKALLKTLPPGLE